MKGLILILTMTAVTLGSPVAAQTGVWEGRTVTLTLPTVLLSEGSSSLLQERPTYIVDLVEDDGRIFPWGAPQWRTAGFPDLGRFEVSKIRTKKKYTEVELKNETRIVKIRFLRSVRDVDAAFAEVTVSGRPDGPEAQAYLENVFPLLSKGLLDGELTHLSDTVKVGLVRAIYESGSHARLSKETYRGSSYLVAQLGRVRPRTRVFMSNPVARAAIFMNDQLLTIAKRFWAPFGDDAKFDGLKIEADLPRRGTAEREEEATDRIEWYAPGQHLNLFAAAEITSAELLVESVVLLEDNRVELPLDVAR